MVTTIIESNPKGKREVKKDGSSILHIAECFSDTIQGENFVGYPSVFLRLQFCTLNCVWCDTTEVWRQGNPYSVNELLKLWEEEKVIDKLNNGQHLVLTGGSPLRQQDALQELIIKLTMDYDCKPFIEIENECTLIPNVYLLSRIDRWNNSPKLENSEMKKQLRYKPEILNKLNKLEDSWFKFVVSNKKDWEEIKSYFISPGYVDINKIVLMPEGHTREELRKRYDWLVDLCCEEGVRFSDRLHITLWDKKTGV